MFTVPSGLPSSSTFSPADPTSSVLENLIEGHHTVLHGVEEAHKYLEDHLIQRSTISEALFPGKRVALLYGREGSGKSILVKKVIGASIAHTMGLVCDFRIQEWNMREFKEWVALRIRDIDELERSAKDSLHSHSRYPDRLTFVIGGLHRFNYQHGTQDVFISLLHLLNRVQLSKPSDGVSFPTTTNQFSHPCHPRPPSPP